MSDTSVKRKLLAVVTGLVVFYALDIGMDRLAVSLIPAHAGISMDVALAKVGIRLPIPALFTATKLLSAFITGVVGALVLRKRDLVLLSLPVLVLEMPFFYMAVGEGAGSFVFELLLGSTVPALACCMLGIWLTTRVRHEV